MLNKIENAPAIDSPLVDMVLNNLDSFNMQSSLNLAKHPKIAGLLINHRLPSVREVVASHKDYALNLIKLKISLRLIHRIYQKVFILYFSIFFDKIIY